MEKNWRNSIGTVASFLREYHSNSFCVWNLTDRSYDYSKFDGKVQSLGFPDHHPPPLDLLFRIVHTLHEWLNKFVFFFFFFFFDHFFFFFFFF